MNIPDVVVGMRETNDLFCAKAIRSRDINALDRVYTPDAQILPPGADIIQGIAGIKNFWLKASSHFRRNRCISHHRFRGSLHWTQWVRFATPSLPEPMIRQFQ